MAHIQRGDERKYFAKGIANKDFTGEYANIVNQMVQGGYTVAQKAYASDLANKQQQFSNELYKKNNELNIKWQADPTNPELEKERKEAFEKIAESFKINPVVQGEWDKMRNEVENRFSQYNTQWQVKQQETNASLNLKNNYEALTNQASMLGYDGADIEQVRLCYANGIEALRKGATPQLGEVVVNDALNSSTHDFMTSYISALAINNPLKAQKLLQDEGVRGDLDSAETIEKLENYVATSLANQSKRTAVSELCNVLRNMKSDEADTILNGQADLNRVMKFIESNKNLPEGSKDLILGIYGIGSKFEYYYDRDRGRITKEEKNSSGRKNALISKLSNKEKIDIADDLEMKLNEMFYFSDNSTVEAKKAVKSKTAGNIQSEVLNRLGDLSLAQGAIDGAYGAGIIDKSKRQSLMNKYVQPMSDYLEANLSDLDEKEGWRGEKLGYGNLVRAFDIEHAGSYKNQVRKDLLTAQGFYYSALDGARNKLGLKSIYDIETLPKKDQEVIYRKASEEAIDFAKRYSQKPELFFKQEYPQLYRQGIELFGQSDGDKVIRNAAKKIYGVDDKSKVDINKIMSDEIANMKSYKQLQAKELVNTIIAVNKMNSENRVLTDLEIGSRAEVLGLTVKELENDAYSKRVSPQMYLIYLEQLKKELQ